MERHTETKIMPSWPPAEDFVNVKRTCKSSNHQLFPYSVTTIRSTLRDKESTPSADVNSICFQFIWRQEADMLTKAVSDPRLLRCQHMLYMNPRSSKFASRRILNALHNKKQKLPCYERKFAYLLFLPQALQSAQRLCHKQQLYGLVPRSPNVCYIVDVYLTLIT
ncbi:hypothetical protein T4D_13558 [Trichinella pseudospiralis]|uniref:Uncharacterized protein n=1 Tax=Trichinella pseudospiralis TaxID=6337 RepID=A0A0V1FGM4_TRIPS|nr:hypothetical protein T4D_13558 [Trichinella pseudospiralis]